MDGSIYQKILEAYANVDSAKRGKLLRIDLHIPSLPQLRTLSIVNRTKKYVTTPEREIVMNFLIAATESPASKAGSSARGVP